VGDTVARLGGDEVAILLEDVAHETAVTEIVEMLRDVIRAPLMIDDVELAIERLGALRELGVRIAVDDFGTGQSSLRYIRRLPIDILKIDKRFIDSVDADDTDSKLTAAIIGLARLLDLGCVAEGVERPAQHERLKELGCEYAQGFLLARPMTPAALSELLSTTAAELIEAR
jgi:EAL domain-containing protein (putative c-di-GMP-specific phosphodiesterase class I)